MPVLTPLTFTIANGASVSDARQSGVEHLHGLVIPATWTAANLTFLGSHDGTTYNTIYDVNGTELTVTAAASRYIGFNGSVLDILDMVPWLKIQSGTTGTPVAQGGARTIPIIASSR